VPLSERTYQATSFLLAFHTNMVAPECVDMTAKVRRNGGWTATNMFKFVQDLQRLGKIGAHF
jgi:hypothetical protein